MISLNALILTGPVVLESIVLIVIDTGTTIKCQLKNEHDAAVKK